MTQSMKHCDIGRLTADAKDILQELEMGRHRERMEQMLSEARVDPVAPYRTKEWYPRFLVWELTLACNMRCEHCGSSAGKARSDELTLDELLRVCDELGELGCERVTLLGGEPLIHPHWEKVAARILENGFRANVITNGWTLDRPELCDRIKAAELTIVGVSVDGLSESHDKLRLRPGSFDRISRGMDLLREREVPVAVPTVVTNDSLNDLEGLYGFLIEKGVKVWQLQIGNPLGRLDRNDPVIIRPERLPELFEFIMAKRGLDDGLRIDISDNVGYYGEYEDRGVRQKKPGEAPYWTGCHAGIQSMGLDSNGDVKGCQSLPSTPEYIAGNVRERPLAEIWNNPEAFPYTRQFTVELLQGYCAECRYGPLCKAGCTSAALAHSGSIGDNPMCVYRASQTK
ncbi:MAG: radical SAM protein [bacterium]